MRRLQTAAAALALAVGTPVLAFDPADTGSSTMFYVSIPLGWELERKDRELSFGLQLQGRREAQAVRIDSKILNFLPAGGLEAKWILAGVVAVGATMALAGKDKATTQQLQQQQTQQEQQQLQQQQQQEQQRQQQAQQQQQQQQPPPCPPKPACK